MRYRLCACALFSLVVIGSTTTAATAAVLQPKQTAPVVVNLDNNGQTIKLKPRQQLLVALRNNSGTGYSWEAVTVPRVLKITSPTVDIPDANPGGLVGTPYTRVFFFTATKGTGKLEIDNVPPGEGEPTTFTLTIQA